MQMRKVNLRIITNPEMNTEIITNPEMNKNTCKVLKVRKKL